MGLRPEEDKGSVGRVVKLEMKHFKESSLARPLMEKYQKDFDVMLHYFLECIYLYHDETPKDLSPSEFRTVVMETLPRRFNGKETFLSEVPKVVRGYTEYLIEEAGLADDPAYLKAVDEMDKKFAKVAKKVKDKDRIGQEEAAPLKKEAEIGRNDPCPCGSGKKYKKCCLGKGK